MSLEDLSIDDKIQMKVFSIGQEKGDKEIQKLYNLHDLIFESKGLVEPSR